MNYSEQERNIYTYPDGIRRGDPLAIRRRLLIHTAGKINDLLDSMESPDPLAVAVAEEQLLPAVRVAFGLRGLEEEAPDTDAASLETLSHFLDWLDGKKVFTAVRPTSPPCTDLPPAWTTKPSSVSP